MFWLGSVVLFFGTTFWLVRSHGSVNRRIWLVEWAVPATALVGVVWLWPPLLILRKAVALFLMPAGLVWLALMAACYVSWRDRRLRWLLGLVVVGYTLAGNAWLGAILLGGLEGPYAGIRPLAGNVAGALGANLGGQQRGEQLPDYDAIFVLGGGSGVTPAGDAQLGASGDRIRLAAALYRAGRTRVLVASGSGFDDRNLAAETFDLWLEMGVPVGAIRRLPETRNTGQEVALYAELIRDEGWGHVGLVTSARHMRRALALCDSYGLEMDPLPADFRSSTRPPSFLMLIPQAAGFQAVAIACWEYLGVLAVRLRI